MPNDIDSRRGLTFGQAEGIEPLPQQLKLGEISAECRAALWAVVYESMQDSLAHSAMGYDGGPWVSEPWVGILRGWHIMREYKMADEFSNQWITLKDRIKAVFTTNDYVKIFNFIQFVAEWPKQPPNFRRKSLLCLRVRGLPIA